MPLLSPQGVLLPHVVNSLEGALREISLLHVYMLCVIWCVRLAVLEGVIKSNNFRQLQSFFRYLTGRCS